MSTIERWRYGERFGVVKAAGITLCSERFIEWDEWTEISAGRGDAAHIHLAKSGPKLVRLLSKITSS